MPRQRLVFMEYRRSRRNQVRRPRSATKPLYEPLEARLLLNADGLRPRPDQTAVPMVAVARETLRIHQRRLLRALSGRPSSAGQ